MLLCLTAAASDRRLAYSTVLFCARQSLRRAGCCAQESAALVRFGNAEEASAALQKINAGQALEIGERMATVALLEGPAEQDFAARQVRGPHASSQLGPLTSSGGNAVQAASLLQQQQCIGCQKRERQAWTSWVLLEGQAEQDFAARQVRGAF